MKSISYNFHLFISISLFCTAWQVEGVIEYCKFVIELQALGMMGTSYKLAPAGGTRIVMQI